MKHVLGFALAALLPGVCFAQYSDGPFADVAALNTYWTGTSTGGSLTQIYVDGAKVFQRSGFGPGYVKQYFYCAPSNDIRAYCNSYSTAAADLADLVSWHNPNWTIYLDGTLYRAGNSAYSEIITCYGDASYYGTVTFYFNSYFNNGFGPPHPGPYPCP